MSRMNMNASRITGRSATAARIVGCLLVAFGLGFGRVCAADFFVATNGSDTNPGTITQPFLTLTQAQAAVRSALPSASVPINVWVRGGTYRLSQPLTFGTNDSGSALAPVTYAGYSNEVVVLSGAISLTPTWSNYTANLKVASIGAGLNFDVLFANNVQQVLARYPNFDTNVTILNGYAADAISSTRAAGWANPTTGLVRGLHGSMWGGNSFKITGVSGGTPTLSWVGDNNRGSGLHATYRMVENLFEELDAPGEWFYDKVGGKLYFYPPAGMNVATAMFDASSLEELIRVVGTAGSKVRFLSFRNFTFTGTRRTLFTRPYESLNRSDWRLARVGAVFIQDAENITIADSIFDRIGGNGVFMSAYNRNHLVTNNEFLDNGATCVNVAGSKDALWNINEWDNYITNAADIINIAGPKTDNYPKDITISNNHMSNLGRFEKQTAGVNLFLAESITVSHNTIHGSPRAGINICDGAWGGHVIEYNDVFDCIRETSDHGPFNSWGRDRFYSIGGYNHNGGGGTTKRPYAFLEAWKTTHIRNNRFHYSEPREFGIDLDDGSSNYEIYNNLILNTSIKLREGFDRKVYNNIMINRGLDLHVWYDTCRDLLSNNIIVSASGYNPINVGGAAEEARTDYNLFYNGGSPVNITTFSWPASDQNSVTANPLFVNPFGNDYSVATNSPALALGFVNFPMNQFGKPGAPQPAPISYVIGPSPDSDAEPLMGATVASIYNLAMQSALAAPDTNGVFFETLPAGSYAALQGFELLDLIRVVNGIPITTKQSFWLIYNSIPAGTTVSCTLLRGGEETTFSFVKTSGPEELNDTAGVIYSGTWTTQKKTNFFNGDIQYTTANGDYFELTFNGTGVAFTSEKYSDMGQVEVYLDGALDQTISCYNNTRLYRQVVYTRTNLPPGLHTLRAVKVDASYMILDSVIVHTPPSLIPTGLVATADNTLVNLQWSAVAGVTNYNLKRATASGGPFTTIASTTTTNYTDLTVVNGVTYYYVVSAVANGVETANSTQASATPGINAVLLVTTSKSTNAPTVSTTDLAQTKFLSSSATGGNGVATRHAELFNGIIGNTDGDTADVGEVTMNNANTVTINLNIAGNTNGYDITGINSYFGWDIASNGRANQGYSILLRFVNDTTATLAGPTHWEPNSPTFYWTTVSFTNDVGGPLRSSLLKLNGAATVVGPGVTATGVKAITFAIANNANAGGSGVVIGREIDIFGVPTASVEQVRPVLLPGWSVTNGNLLLPFTGVVGRCYRVESAPQLTAPVQWQMVTNIASLAASPFVVAVPMTNRAGFYRLVWLP